MAEFDDQTKLRIVLALARFETPSAIIAALTADGITGTSHRQIGAYDPSRGYYEAGDRYREIFDEAREKYIKDVSTVPIANQGFRLNALQQTWEAAMAKGNRVLANATLRQAAEEVGGALTNERNVNVRKGVEELSPEERRSAMVELIQKALEAPDPTGTTKTVTATVQ